MIRPRPPRQPRRSSRAPFGRVVVGLGVAADRVRAVGVHDRRVQWAVEAERQPEEPLSSALAALLSRCPISRWPRPSAYVGVGPGAVQVKRLERLPPLADPAALAALVQENASRFFLRTGAPLAVAGVRVVEPGSAWAAAFEAPLVSEIEQACRAARLRLRVIAPTAIALGHALDGGRIVWDDGAVRVAIDVTDEALASIRRLPRRCAMDEEHALARPVAPLAALGEGAYRFADAYGATRVSHDEPLALTTDRGIPRLPPSRSRLATAAVAFLAAGAGALVAPGLVAARAGHRAVVETRALAAEVDRARTTERELGRVTEALDEVASFVHARRPATLVMRDVARALPDSAALFTVQLDTAGGMLVAIAPRADRVLSALEQIPSMSGPEVVGPITRESSAGRDLERVTVRFQFVTPPAARAPDVASGVRR